MRRALLIEPWWWRDKKKSQFSLSLKQACLVARFISDGPTSTDNIDRLEKQSKIRVAFKYKDYVHDEIMFNFVCKVVTAEISLNFTFPTTFMLQFLVQTLGGLLL